MTRTYEHAIPTADQSYVDYVRGQMRNLGIVNTPVLPIANSPLTTEEISALGATSSEALAIDNLANSDRQFLIEEIAKERKKFQYNNPYFAGTTSAVFIGDKWVDNIVTLEYTETVSKVPLYGYMSTHWDAIAKGNTIVQGQFSIAFTSNNYLGNILKNYQTKSSTRETNPLEITDPIERAKKLFWNLELPDNAGSIEPLEYGYIQGITGEVRPGFNIMIFYGAEEFIRGSVGGAEAVNASKPVEEIRNVHLLNRSVVHSPTGEPIGETYSFLAREITTRGYTRKATKVHPVSVGQNGSIPITDTTGKPTIILDQNFITDRA